jgi:hypothetical protein
LGPNEWGKRRPFAFELSFKATGTELTPRRGDEYVHRKLKRIKGIRLRRDGSYVVGRKDEQATPRDFYWFALRSLRDSEYMDLWIFLHSVLNSSDYSTSAKEIADLTGGDSTVCGKWLDGLADKHMVTRNGSRYLIENPGEFTVFLQKLHSAAPKPVDEVVMGFLCSNYGSSKGDVCDWMNNVSGVTFSTTYKATENLENGGFVRVVSTKHLGKKGPASDHLFVCCNNCFFLFSSQEECVDFEITKFGQNIEKCFGRELRNEERIALVEFVKARPEGPQLLRKLNEILQYFERLKKDIDREEYLKKTILFLEKELELPLRLL